MPFDHMLYIPTLHAEGTIAELVLLGDIGFLGGLRWLWLMVQN